MSAKKILMLSLILAIVLCMLLSLSSCGYTKSEIDAMLEKLRAEESDSSSIKLDEAKRDFETKIASLEAAITDKAKENEDKTVMVVTHGGLIRALRCRWNGLCMTTAQSIPHVPNASVTIVEYDNGKFDFKEVAMAGHLRSLSTEKDIKQLF
jgi:broad specificity phosphatase PhoE